MKKYLEIPWSYQDTIDNLEEIKDHIQSQVIMRNLHGRGEKDAEEVAFDFDRAIKALEKQIPQEWIEYNVAEYCECPICGSTFGFCDNETEHFEYCPRCGQRLED